MSSATTAPLDLDMIEEMLKQATDEATTRHTKKEVDDVTKVEIPEFLLGEGKGSFLKSFAITPKPKRDHDVSIFKPEEWDALIRDFVPPEKEEYVFQPQIELLHVAVEQGETVLITGPTGSGKSTMVEQYCAKTKRPFIRINMTGDMESSTFFGQLVVEDGATVWKDGPITEAVRYGGICLVDEWEFCPPEITYGLQWLLEDDPKLLLKEMPSTTGEKWITPHPEFRLIAGGNTKGLGDITGQYAGAQVQSQATIDRFQTMIHLGYLNKAHELKVIQGTVPEIDTAIVNKMIQFAGLVRNGHKQGKHTLTMSPRTLINWARKIMYWGDVKVALMMAFLDKCPENEQAELIRCFEKAFGLGKK